MLRIFATYIGHFLSDSLEIVRTSLDYCNDNINNPRRFLLVLRGFSPFPMPPSTPVVRFCRLFAETGIFLLVRPALDVAVNQPSQLVEADFIADSLHPRTVPKIHLVIVRAVQTYKHIALKQSSVHMEFQTRQILEYDRRELSDTPRHEDFHAGRCYQLFSNGLCDLYHIFFVHHLDF